MKIVSFYDLASLLALTKDESDYPVLTLLETSAIAAIESFILRTIKKATIEQRLLTWGKYIALDGIPVFTINSVATDSGITYDSTQYYIRDYGLEMLSYIDDSPLTINYSGGYSKIPAQIYRAVLIQTAYEFQNRDHIGAQSVNTEGGSVQTPSLQLLPEVLRLLKNYKHPMRAFL